MSVTRAPIRNAAPAATNSGCRSIGTAALCEELAIVSSWFQTANGNAKARRRTVGRRSPARRLTLGRASGLEQEPCPPFGLIDPDFEQACRRDVPVIVVEGVRAPHFRDQLLVVLTKLRKHVERRDEIGVIIEKSLAH